MNKRQLITNKQRIEKPRYSIPANDNYPSKPASKKPVRPPANDNYRIPKQSLNRFANGLPVSRATRALRLGLRIGRNFLPPPLRFALHLLDQAQILNDLVSGFTGDWIRGTAYGSRRLAASGSCRHGPLRRHVASGTVCGTDAGVTEAMDAQAAAAIRNPANTQSIMVNSFRRFSFGDPVGPYIQQWVHTTGLRGGMWAPMSPLPFNGAIPSLSAALAGSPSVHPTIRRKAHRARPERVPMRLPPQSSKPPRVTSSTTVTTTGVRVSPFVNPWRPTVPTFNKAPSAFPSSRPPPRGTKETKVMSRVARIGVTLASALDKISESAEVIDAVYQALPKEIRKKYDRKERLGDNIGQYGISGADWKLEALYAEFNNIDWEQAIKNIVQNEIEDRAYGLAHGARDDFQGRNISDTFRRRQSRRRSR